MPKLNVYVSESLSARIRDAGVAVSATCQRALEEEVRRIDAQRAADERVRRMADRLRTLRITQRPDDDERESDGHTAGLDWATNVATIHELTEVVKAGEVGHFELPVGRDSGSLERVLADAGVPSDSETQRVVSTLDPWGRGFLQACQEMWHKVRPLM